MYSAIPYDNQRAKYMNYTTFDIFKYNACLMKNIDDNIDYSNLNNIVSNKTIAVVKSSSLGKYIKNKYPNAKFIEVSKTTEGFKKLENRKIDLFAINSATAEYMINVKGYKNLEIATKLDYIFKLKIAISNTMPKEVLSIIDKTLTQIDKKEIDNIYNKWMKPVLIENKINWNIIVSIIIIILIIVLFISYRQILLSKHQKILESTITKKTKDLHELNKNLENIVKLRTKELKEQKDRYQFAIDGSNDGIWDWHIDTNEVYFSPKWKEIIGYKDDEFPNKYEEWEKRVHPDDLQKVMKQIELNFNGHKNTYIIEYRLKHKDGHWVWILDRAKTMYDKNSKAVRMSGFHTDLTEQKVQTAQLLKSEKLASMGEIIGNIGHHWRQPLSVISTASSGMKMQKEFGLLTDELFLESCDIINDNTQYLSKTIDDFNNYIKSDSTKKLFNLNDNIHEFLNIVESSIKIHNLNIILNLHMDLKVDCYANELTQCFINIFNNSKDTFVEKEINYKLLFISSESINNTLIIKIKDNAGGIKEDILNKVLEPYFTTKHRSQGTGLGLHMTYNLIVDGMGGTIEANNVSYEYDGKEYIGAEFTISLSMS